MEIENNKTFEGIPIDPSSGSVNTILSYRKIIESLKISNIKTNGYQSLIGASEIVSSLEMLDPKAFFLLPFEAILILDGVRKLFTIKLDSQQFAIMHALMKYYDRKDGISREDGLSIVNEYQLDKGKEQLSSQEYYSALKDLESFKCLHEANGKIFIDERVIELDH